MERFAAKGARCVSYFTCLSVLHFGLSHPLTEMDCHSCLGARISQADGGNNAARSSLASQPHGGIGAPGEH